LPGECLWSRSTRNSISEALRFFRVQRLALRSIGDAA
jgi:hypothetical protein